jgi:Ala-tRNA(Pro) deacylase
MTQLQTSPSEARPGDTIVVGGHRVGDPGRSGTVLEVLGAPDHRHYRVRWEDERETLFYPAGDIVIRHPVARALVAALAEGAAHYELIHHERTMTAAAEAKALGIEGSEVAKTLVVSTGHGYVRVVVPASRRLDLHRLRELPGVDKAARLATEAELAAAYPDFELGAVPPLGGPAGDRVVVDRPLAELESLVFEAGTHSESVRLRTDDLLRLTEARVADVSTD